MPIGLNRDFLSQDALDKLGFASLGENVLVHSTCVIVDPAGVSLGSHVRVDPFCVLSGKQIEIGNNVEISIHSALLGQARITFEDYSNLAPRVMVFSSNDDYLGHTLAGPLVPQELRGAIHADVRFERHVIIGAGSMVMPGVTVGKGSVVGALSLVKQSLEPWGVYAGVPVRRIRDRAKDAILSFEQELMHQSHARLPKS